MQTIDKRFHKAFHSVSRLKYSTREPPLIFSVSWIHFRYCKEDFDVDFSSTSEPGLRCGNHFWDNCIENSRFDRHPFIHGKNTGHNGPVFVKVLNSLLSVLKPRKDYKLYSSWSHVCTYGYDAKLSDFYKVSVSSKQNINFFYFLPYIILVTYNCCI